MSSVQAFYVFRSLHLRESLLRRPPLLRCREPSYQTRSANSDSPGFAARLFATVKVFEAACLINQVKHAVEIVDQSDDTDEAAAQTDFTIAVLSETYLKSEYTQPEWAAAS